MQMIDSVVRVGHGISLTVNRHPKYKWLSSVQHGRLNQSFVKWLSHLHFGWRLLMYMYVTYWSIRMIVVTYTGNVTYSSVLAVSFLCQMTCCLTYFGRLFIHAYMTCVFSYVPRLLTTHYVQLGKKRRERSNCNHYIISPRVIVKAIIMIHTFVTD